MIKIRRGVFETNSSSVHAIAIVKSKQELNSYYYDEYCDHKDEDYSYRGNSLVIKPGRFEWENKRLITPEDKASYLMTTAMLLGRFEEFKEKLSTWLKEKNIKFRFKDTPEELKFDDSNDERYNLEYYILLHKKYDDDKDKVFSEEELKREQLDDLCVENGIFIDHFNDDNANEDLLNYVLESSNNLFSYLFNRNSFVWTGNDNSEDTPNVDLIDKRKAKCFVKGN